jgi:hypothetical protein
VSRQTFAVSKLVILLIKIARSTVTTEARGFESRRPRQFPGS